MSKHRPVGASHALCYVGNGRWIRGVPARDLNPSEAARFNAEALLASGLYRTADGSVAISDDRTRALPNTEAASEPAAVPADDGKE